MDTYGNIVNKSTLNECGNTFECPVCGCGDNALGDRWVQEEVDYVDDSMKVCLSCICVDDTNNYVVDCNNDEKYASSEDRNCPISDLTCYYGISSGDDKTRTDFATAQGKCQLEYGVCGWDREYSFFDDVWENKWGCTDSVCI